MELSPKMILVAFGVLCRRMGYVSRKVRYIDVYINIYIYIYINIYIYNPCVVVFGIVGIVVCEIISHTH